MQGDSHTLRFWQQNVNKSLIAQSELICRISPDDADIVAIQEPYLDHLNLTRATSHWVVVYPTSHAEGRPRTRSVFLISKRISTNAWTPISLPSPDATAIALQTGAHTLLIYNIYLAQDNDSTIHAVARSAAKTIRDLTGQGQHAQQIWMGDFNRHHPLWDEPRNHHLFTAESLRRAQVLLNRITEFGLEMALPEAVPTLEAFRSKNLTRPDNVFVSEEITDTIITCRTVPEQRPPNTDHFPIYTQIEIGFERAARPPTKNFRRVDWDAFRKTLKEQIDRRTSPDRVDSPQQFDDTLAAVMESIDEATKEHVPERQPAPFAKRWWSTDLSQLRKEVQRLGRTAHRHRGEPAHPSHKCYRKARNRYTDEIKMAKKDHWNAWLDSVNRFTIWQAHRFVNYGPSDGGSTRIPPLRAPGAEGEETLLMTNESKGAQFYKTFFLPAGPPPSLSEDFAYPPPQFTFRSITNTQVERTMKSLRSFKVPGPDGIPNEVYKQCAEILAPVLGGLFRATFRLNYYPEQWKVSDTVVLRKPGKPDYATAKAYRPIALLSCMSKILSRCVADVLVFEAESRGLLADYQFGGRAGRTTTDSIHLVVKLIKDAWRRGEVASVLFLDIKSAFPAATPERLFHNMRMRGVPEEIVRWLRTKLSNRQTRLKFDDFVSDWFEIHSGIDQGCPLSVILYAFYNADLIDRADTQKGVTAVGSMDDAALVATGKTFAAVHDNIRDYMSGPGGAYEWSASHNSAFSEDKFGLLNCALKLRGLGPALNLGAHLVTPTDHHRFLGVLLDHKLRFHQHVNYALAKGAAWASLIRRLARARHGLALKVTRRLYLAVAIPSMLYAADVFLSPIRQVDDGKRLRGSVGAIRKLTKVHRQALLAITGIMRTAATDVMEAHANLLPFKLIVEKLCFQAAARMCTLPRSHPLRPHITRTYTHAQIKRHRTPLHDLFRAFQPHLPISRMETISPTRRHPRWAPRHDISIADTKEEAEQDDREWARKRRIRVYSDGSDIDGGVGAAAVLIRPSSRRRRCLQLFLGPSTERMVYEAETVGAMLGVELLRTERALTRRTSVALDGLSAIQATQAITPRSGQHLTDMLTDHIAALRAQHEDTRLTLRWVPGHYDIEGNELADEAAKEAARGTSSALARLPKPLRAPLPISLSKVKQNHAAALRQQAATEWAESVRGKRLRVIDSTMPSKAFDRLIAGLSRRLTCALIQLRTGHAPLNEHLHRIGKAETAICPACGREPESVSHYLLRCEAFDAQRWRCLAPLGRDGRKLSTLLNSEKGLKPLFDYVNATGRLRGTFGALEFQEEAEDN